ncbi:hypothetical protein AB0L13_27280 [Saccharopolyspora shandongensis]|uniref:hypothetical protein n=1 Tax=Saccharopolyspora shandongensis TaxID=418495 RepID=UPI00344331C2
MTGDHHACSRRGFLALAAAIAVPLPGCAQQGELGGVPPWMLTPDTKTDPDLDRDVRIIHELLVHHQEIARTVDDFSYGVRATTTSANRDVAANLRTHVERMRWRLARGDAIRQLDPLFAELFKHHAQIDLQVEPLPDGVRVLETSSDPRVVMLLRQHAVAAVSEFAAEGVERALRPTPLPPGYSA